jgi:predicted O-methyltransferase YrrM
MLTGRIGDAPPALAGILRETARIGFTMASEEQVGALLRGLVASKPAGRFLELGTGTGVGAAWMLDGMDARSHLDTVDNDATTSSVARKHLGGDARVTFHLSDAAEYLTRAAGDQYDLVYADAWPGKFSHLDLVLDLIRPGGIYFVDDLLPQPNWPSGHAEKIPLLVADLERRPQFTSVTLAWASGVMMLVKRT